MKKLFKHSAKREYKTKEALADEMNISLRTLQRKLNRAGLEIPRGHNPPDVQDLIYETLGWKVLARNGVK